MARAALRIWVTLALLVLPGLAYAGRETGDDHRSSGGKVRWWPDDGAQSGRISQCAFSANNCRQIGNCIQYQPANICGFEPIAPALWNFTAPAYGFEPIAPALRGHLACASTPLPTVYQLLSSNPNFTIATLLIQQLNLVAAFNSSFTGTLLAPTDAAFTAYLSTLEIDITNPQYAQYLPVFLIPLLQYHILLRRLFIYQMRPMAYSTAYMSINAIPHKVSVINNGSCTSQSNSAKDQRRGQHNKGRLVNYYLRDEQGFNVTFAGVDAIVAGGGAVHAINSVLQPNDLYPSVTALLTRNPALFSNLTSLVLLVDQQLAQYNISVLNTLETTPGSIAAPVNSAFVGLDTSGLSLKYILQTLLYHFCPADSVADILRTPYTQDAGYNPCATLLNIANPMALSTGLLYTFKSTNVLNFTAGIDYLSGKALPPPAQITTEKTAILMANVKTPISSSVAIDKVMLPPTGLPNPVLP